MHLVGHYAIGQPHVDFETLVQGPRHELHEVLLKILIDIRTRNLNQQRVGSLIVCFEYDGLEPGSVDLLRDVLLNQFQAVAPKRLMTILHRR